MTAEYPIDELKTIDAETCEAGNDYCLATQNMAKQWPSMKLLLPTAEQNSKT
jgi:hypothetical protein